MITSHRDTEKSLSLEENVLARRINGMTMTIQYSVLRIVALCLCVSVACGSGK